MNTEVESKKIRTKPFGFEWPGSYFAGQEELDLVTKVVKAQSPFRYYGLDCQHMCDKFEKEFQDYLGVEHVLSVNSGTAALNIAMAALGIGPGQEVIVPGYMWISTIAAVVNRGAIPVIAEIDDSYCLDPEDVKKKVTSKTTTIVHIHMSGATGNLEQILKIAKDNNLKLLEDCAQVGGGSFKGKTLGSLGDISIFSFQYNKTMTTGEGGAVATNDYTLWKRSQAAQDIGHSRNIKGRLEVNPKVLLWGLGCRMTDLQGAFGLAQLRKLDDITHAMRTAKYKLREGIADIDGLVLRRIEDPAGDNGAFIITKYKDEATAKAMAQELLDLGLDNGPGGLMTCHFYDWGFHLYYNLPALVTKASASPDGFPWTHPLNKDSNYNYDKGALPQTDDLFARSVIQAIPSNTTDEDVQDMIKIYKTAAKNVM